MSLLTNQGNLRSKTITNEVLIDKRTHKIVKYWQKEGFPYIDTGKTLYILDEPTTGLHFHDIKQLLLVITRLRDRNNTIVIIEHNLDVIKTADWVIDLGPEGGNKGGEIIAFGTPEMISQSENSFTGQFLKKHL